MNMTFDPQTLADDLSQARSVYAGFFANLDETSWDRPVKGGPKEWTLHETVAHLVALNGAGLESVQYALRGDLPLFLRMDTLFSVDARPKGAMLAKTALTSNG
jgi:hypothetical protein